MQISRGQLSLCIAYKPIEVHRATTQLACFFWSSSSTTGYVTGIQEAVHGHGNQAKLIHRKSEQATWSQMTPRFLKPRRRNPLHVTCWVLEIRGLQQETLARCLLFCSTIFISSEPCLPIACQIAAHVTWQVAYRYLINSPVRLAVPITEHTKEFDETTYRPFTDLCACRGARFSPPGLSGDTISAPDSSKGGAVETGCSGSHYLIGCFII